MLFPISIMMEQLFQCTKMIQHKYIISFVVFTLTRATTWYIAQENNLMAYKIKLLKKNKNQTNKFPEILYSPRVIDRIGPIYKLYFCCLYHMYIILRDTLIAIFIHCSVKKKKKNQLYIHT